MSTSRATIPNNVRKTVLNIKEIARNHSDEEIYAMLKECSMDPNETAQKLLFQDTFHEVKRKRDKKKEAYVQFSFMQSLNTKERAESRWRAGMQGRGARGGSRGGYSSRYVSHGRNANAGNENGVNQCTHKESISTMSLLQNMDNKKTSPATVMANGLTNIADNISNHGYGCHTTNFSTQEKSSAQSSYDNFKNIDASVAGEHREQARSQPNSEQLSSSMVAASVSSSLDPVLFPSLDARTPGRVGAIKQVVGVEQTSALSNAVPNESKPSLLEFADHMPINEFLSTEVVDSGTTLVSEKVGLEIDNIKDGNIPNRSEYNVPSEASQAQQQSLHAVSSCCRPSSNYSNQSQPTGTQKVGLPSKEWKSKLINANATQSSSALNTSDVAAIVFGSKTQSLTSSDATAAEEATLKLQKRLEELHFSDGQNVFIPNHLQVPESEKARLSFGSLDAIFGKDTNIVNGADNGRSATPLSFESSPEMEESAEEPSSSVQNISPSDHEGDDLEHSQSPTNIRANPLPGEADVPSSISPGLEYNQSKSEPVFPPDGLQCSAVHSTPKYSTLEWMPSVLGSQCASFDKPDTQPSDASRLQSFIVQQPFDPTSYYTQFYRPSADVDGRFSPFIATGSAKYNGNTTVLPANSGQSSQESVNSVVLSSTGSAPLANQAAGVMQSSITVTQQPVPVFRQPAGLHISHYPPNYIPYNQYFPPFYVPPPTIHHFLSHAIPQQPPAGGIFQNPAASAVKYSLPQFKPGINAPNSAHIGMVTGYGPYTSAPTVHIPSPAVSAGNSSGNDDSSAAQYKENNAYIAGQQNEGSAVWIPAPGRDISALQVSSFFNPPQGQHMTLPPQTGHGAFTGIFHPTQTMAAAVHPLLQQPQTMAGPVEIVSTPTGVYQQPQRPQINWANNY